MKEYKVEKFEIGYVVIHSNSKKRIPDSWGYYDSEIDAYKSKAKLEEKEQARQQAMKERRERNQTGD